MIWRGKKLTSLSNILLLKKNALKIGSELTLNIYKEALNYCFALVYQPVSNFLLLTVYHRTRLRVSSLISTISTTHVCSDAVIAEFTLSSTPEIVDFRAKFLPTGELS